MTGPTPAQQARIDNWSPGDLTESTETRRSDIRGEGHGAAHSWMHDTTEPFNGDMGSRYFCRVCGECFVHMYNWQPDVFAAMEADGIPAECKPRTTREEPQV